MLSLPEQSGVPLQRAHVHVSPCQITDFEKRLAGLNKKASAFGLPPVGVLGKQSRYFKQRSESLDRDGDRTLQYLVPAKADDTEVVKLFEIELEFPIVKLGQWRVVGKLDAMPGGNIMFCVSKDLQDLEAMRERSGAAITCEHCLKKRARVQSYLLRDLATGAFKQVGKSCLEDFTGMDPSVVLFLAQMQTVITWAEGEAEEWTGPRRGNAVNTVQFLADVSFCIGRGGFTSASMARARPGLSPTYAEARFLPQEIAKLGPSSAIRIAYIDQRDFHRSRAEETIAWFAAKPGGSDFDNNVKLLLNEPHIETDSRYLAFAAAAVSSFLSRAVDLPATEGPRGHVGSEGEAMDAQVTVQRIVPLNSLHGLCHLVSLRDSSGNSLLWKASSCPQDFLSRGLGRTLQARFRVKQHGSYQGAPQTTITRLKVLHWLDAEGNPLAEESRIAV